jgi:hypothetical protein
MSKKILIIEPGGFGDALIVFPIAKYYADQGNAVTMLVQEKILPLRPYVPYVTLKNIVEQSEYDETIDLEIGSENRKEVTNAWRKENKRHFDEWKYDTAGVPFEEKFKLQHGLNVAASATLMTMFDLTLENYIVVCCEDSNGKNQKMVDFVNMTEAKSKIPIFEIAHIDGFTIFDWGMVIRGAAYGYFVDSALGNLANGCHLLEGRRSFLPNHDKWGEHSLICTPILSKGWTTIAP